MVVQTSALTEDADNSLPWSTGSELPDNADGNGIDQLERESDTNTTDFVRQP